MHTPQLEALSGMTPLGLKPSPRLLSVIAREIVSDWHNVNYAAKPYLDAMLQLNSIRDKYYQDSAQSIVLYFLANARGWKGEKAKAIKEELKNIKSIHRFLGY